MRSGKNFANNYRGAPIFDPEKLCKFLAERVKYNHI